jgi:hypothetical protein
VISSGLGGFSDVGWIEVYGKPVKRAATSVTSGSSPHSPIIKPL